MQTITEQEKLKLVTLIEKCINTKTTLKDIHLRVYEYEEGKTTYSASVGIPINVNADNLNDLLDRLLEKFDQWEKHCTNSKPRELIKNESNPTEPELQSLKTITDNTMVISNMIEAYKEKIEQLKIALQEAMDLIE